MKTKFCCLLVLVLGTGACSRQAKQAAVSSAYGAQSGAATAAAAPAQIPVADTTPAAAGNPEPVERPPVEASIPTAASAPSAPAAPTRTAAPPPAETAPVAPAPPAYVARPVPAQAILPAGTRIRVRLGKTLDSKYSRPGERFVAYLADPVVLSGRVVVPRGTEFEGRVVEAKRGGRLKGRGYLGVRLDSFRLHGRTYRIATAADLRESRSHKKRNVEIIGGSAGTGATVGAVAGGGVGALVGAGAGAVVGTTGAFITGRRDVKLPVETPLVFSLRGPVAVRG